MIEAILNGSYMEHIVERDPDTKACLLKTLNDFIERDRGCELFDICVLVDAPRHKEEQKRDREADRAHRQSTRTTPR